ncbi:hypothetical protein ABT025_18825 [Streptomyces sp. NPDC002809]|uniref:hypothetical protein n=1 Tax=Streptomyces sp. NPDC002809 TaxID=3154433 RepID=UPI003322A93F
MSASTVPAAVPEPNNNASTTSGTPPQNAPGPGLFASMVAPVEPARPTFDLAPATIGQADTEGGTGLPAEGISSASFNDEKGTLNGAGSDTKDSSTGKQQTGIWRAWLIAGATRWGRGGGTANKRLDMHKARAQAQQVKETRTVTLNRTPTGQSGGGRSAGAPGGKGLNGKSSTSGGPQGSKNAGPAAKNDNRGPSNRSGNTNAGTSGRGTKGGTGGAGAGADRGPSRGTATKNGPTPKQQKPAKPDNTPTPKPTKTRTDTDQRATKPSPGSPAGAKGTAGAAGAAGAAGKDGAAPKIPAPAKDTPASKPKVTGTGTAKGAKDETDSPGRKTTGGETAKDTDGAPTPTGRKWSLVKGDKTAKTIPDKPAAPRDKKPDTANHKPDPKAADPKPAPAAGTKTDKPADQTQDTTPGKRLLTKGSRETGYRDGTRAAQATAHVKAYRDGVKDGWTDTMATADREKTSLDHAHAARQQARQETPVTTATSTDRQTTDPIPVHSVSKTHVFLGDGDNRASMTRGEVRSLKSFERRLEERATTLTSRAEQTRSLKAHAEEQATQANRLLEAARSAKAGAKYIGTLTRLQEAAKGQAAKADEIHKQSLRGAELCRTTLANVQARYGGIYQAVIDSPETSPAELDFYEG